MVDFNLQQPATLQEFADARTASMVARERRLWQSRPWILVQWQKVLIARYMCACICIHAPYMFSDLEGKVHVHSHNLARASGNTPGMAQELLKQVMAAVKRGRQSCRRPTGQPAEKHHCLQCRQEASENAAGVQLRKAGGGDEDNRANKASKQERYRLGLRSAARLMQDE